MFCGKCGTANQDGSMFCMSCGGPLNAATSQNNAYVPNNANIQSNTYMNQNVNAQQNMYSNQNYNWMQQYPAKNVSKANPVGKILALVGAGLMALGVFLPCFILFEEEKFNFIRVEGETGDGIFVLIAGIVAILVNLIGKGGKGSKITSVIMAAISMAITIYDLSNMMDVLDDATEPGIGIYVIIIGAVLLVVSSFIPKKKY